MGSNSIFPHQLSPVDHLSPRIHVPKLLYFASDATPAEIEATFRDGLARSIAALPLLGGSVGILDNASQKGTLAVQAPEFTATQILSIRDVREQYVFGDIKAKHFPPDAINIDEFMGMVAEEPQRVLHAQANLIRGGLVLVIAIHHCVVDETGIFDVVRLWAGCCNGSDESRIVKPEWTDRSLLMIGEGTGKLEDHPEYTLLPAEKSTTNDTKTAEYISKASDMGSSAILFFSYESLARLKIAARARDGDWISTNDAMCALMWSRVTKARQETGMGGIPYSMFNMVVNRRSRMKPPVSEEYMGNVVFVSKAFQTTDTLVATVNLSGIAATLQKSVQEIDDQAIKDKIKAVASVNDIGRLAPVGYNSHGRHLGCTSWASQSYYSLDWGKTLGGRCERVRWRNKISDGIRCFSKDYGGIWGGEKWRLGGFFGIGKGAASMLEER
ncbi:related to trichothecene 3-O-acetyltransferase [Rhynchosporium agropyri]|uniref:Related to trichothecene 3-O-acetyltransferase n=1 Tax=Rhynchosporium agropyri TaxID=914238 RepID=A0A1E1L1E5_9HELO|nr:related to trichothecene 3-O-acetyltransferase [Rhynchosporium agropyri]